MTTRLDYVAEVADGLYRIHTPLPDAPGGFSFNQYLLVDGEAMLFHTGPRALSDRVIAAVRHVVSLETLRWVGFAHVEADECGSLNAILAAAPHAEPVTGRVGAMVQADLFDRPPRALADGETLTVGDRALRWVDAPHVPHGWDNGFLFEPARATLLCGDLFTQPGTGDAALSDDVLEPSERFRSVMDYFAHAPHTEATLRKLAALEPRVLACMHGSAFVGAGGALLHRLADAFRPTRA